MNLTKDQYRRIAYFVVAALILAANVFLGVKFPLPPEPEEMRVIQLEDELVPLGTTHFDDLQLTGLLQPGFTDLTATDGMTITPEYTVYALDTSGAVTVTLAASAEEGQLLVLINDDANATIIADTNLRSSDGSAITLAGAYDVVLFVYQDSEWLEIAKSADS
jgi:hypothetical protein